MLFTHMNVHAAETPMTQKAAQNDTACNATSCASFLQSASTSCINPNKLLDLIDQVYQASQSFINEDIVYILGHTGVGKSTIINYLNYACNYQEGEDGLEPIDQTKEKAQTSHEESSKTIIPKLHGEFCDLAGLEDNRFLEERMAAHLGLELSNKMARTLKLIIVFDVSVLKNTTNRGESFLNMVELMARVFRVKESKSREEFLDNQDILFLFNKLGHTSFRWTQDKIIQKIQALIERIKKTMPSSIEKVFEGVAECMGRFWKVIKQPNEEQQKLIKSWNTIPLLERIIQRNSEYDLE